MDFSWPASEKEYLSKQVILDRDVAELYGVETRRINEALKNNPDKFPDGYVIELTNNDSILRLFVFS